MKTTNQHKATLTIAIAVAIIACGKGNDDNASSTADGTVTNTVETSNGITYKVYAKRGQTNYKGILVMGSGNDENNPTAGSLDGNAENSLCKKAAENGFISAVVQYRKGVPNVNDDTWNKNAEMLGQDFDNCITALSTKYGVDKNRSVVGGYSYATFMLYTVNSTYHHLLSSCKGILGACGSTSAYDAQNFKIPIFAINCAGGNEGNFSGIDLYNAIPDNSPAKAKSEGFTDNACNTHCGGSWTGKMYSKLTDWLP
jgi:Poly(3-hydroxybutyrate) depolymerase